MCCSAAFEDDSSVRLDLHSGNSTLNHSLHSLEQAAEIHLNISQWGVQSYISVKVLFSLLYW